MLVGGGCRSQGEETRAAWGGAPHDVGSSALTALPCPAVGVQSMPARLVVSPPCPACWPLRFANLTATGAYVSSKWPACPPHHPGQIPLACATWKLPAAAMMSPGCQSRSGRTFNAADTQCTASVTKASVALQLLLQLRPLCVDSNALLCICIVPIDCSCFVQFHGEVTFLPH